jgi:hypothetical protein
MEAGLSAVEAVSEALALAAVLMPSQQHFLPHHLRKWPG